MRLLILILFFINFKVFALDIENYEQLNSAVASPSGDCELNVTRDLDADCALGKLAKDTLEIEGNNYTLNGCGCSGIDIENDSYLSLKDLNIEGFSSYEGAVLNNSSSKGIDIFNCTFSNNSSVGSGGVIYNRNSINNLNSDFLNNSASYNGAGIYNDFGSSINSIVGNFKNNTSVEGFGGAIFNFGTIKSINGNFENNSSPMQYGGAITNQGEIGKIQGEFLNNSAGVSAGAIYNFGHIGEISAKFQGNSTTMEMMGGGAIANFMGHIDKLSGEFIDNTSSYKGGAIYNYYGDMNIVADSADTIFHGNKDISGSNAIYNEEGTINLYAGDYSIIFDDKISGMSPDSSIININPDDKFSNWGRIYINNDIAQNAVNMYNGVLAFGNGNFLNSSKFDYYNGTISLQNKEIQSNNFGNLELHNDMNIDIDVSPTESSSDTFNLNSFKSNNYNIYINDVDIIDSPRIEKFSVSPLSLDMDEDLRNELMENLDYKGDRICSSEIFDYIVEYDKTTGLLNFSRAGFNPAALISPIAAQIGGYLTAIDIYDRSFTNMDMYMLLSKNQRINQKYANLYASNEPLYGSVKTVYDKKYGWFRPYTVIENIPLKNAPNVRNTGWGSLFGVEFERIKLKHNQELILNPFFAYDGSHQSYQDIGIYQNGGFAGFNSVYYKNNFFTGVTALVGSNACHAQSSFGEENFAMIIAGIASKTGYNFEFFDGRFIIQPDFLISYTYIYTFDYKNAQNDNMDTKSLNAIQLEPGIKLIGNLKNNFQPYIGVSVVFNIIDKAKFKVNDVSLPDIAIKPFVRYGLGIRKIWSDKFDTFFQTFVTNGGRNGVGFLAGLRYEFGDL